MAPTSIGNRRKRLIPNRPGLCVEKGPPAIVAGCIDTKSRHQACADAFRDEMMSFSHNLVNPRPARPAPTDGPQSIHVFFRLHQQHSCQSSGKMVQSAIQEARQESVHELLGHGVLESSPPDDIKPPFIDSSGRYSLNSPASRAVHASVEINTRAIIVKLDSCSEFHRAGLSPIESTKSSASLSPRHCGSRTPV